MMVKENFKKWALGYSGCNGGDIGSESNKSIWVSGIEWGVGHDVEELKESINFNVETPPRGYSKWDEALDSPFVQIVVKLLSSIHGYKTEEYKEFGEKYMPFAVGGKGLFNLNLYPIAFHSTDPSLWKDEFYEITGFNNKEDYQQWCEEHRFSKISQWSDAYKPKAIICLGKAYCNQYRKIFMENDSPWREEEIGGKKILWGINKNGSYVFVLPFASRRPNCLCHDITIEQIGLRIGDLLEMKSNTL